MILACEPAHFFGQERENKEGKRKGGGGRKSACTEAIVFRVGINRLYLATFERLLTFSATFCSASNIEQLLPSLATIEQQIGIKLIQTTKKVFS